MGCHSGQGTLRSWLFHCFGSLPLNQTCAGQVFEWGTPLKVMIPTPHWLFPCRQVGKLYVGTCGPAVMIQSEAPCRLEVQRTETLDSALRGT